MLHKIFKCKQGFIDVANHRCSKNGAVKYFAKFIGKH